MCIEDIKSLSYVTKRECDVKLEDNLAELQEVVDELKTGPITLSKLKQACRSIRKAKLLLFSLQRYPITAESISVNSFLILAREVLEIAERTKINDSQESFTLVSEVVVRLRCLAKELAEHIPRPA